MLTHNSSCLQYMMGVEGIDGGGGGGEGGGMHYKRLTDTLIQHYKALSLPNLHVAPAFT